MLLKVKCVSILHAFKKGDPGGVSILYLQHFAHLAYSLIVKSFPNKLSLT